MIVLLSFLMIAVQEYIIKQNTRSSYQQTAGYSKPIAKTGQLHYKQECETNSFILKMLWWVLFN